MTYLYRTFLAGSSLVLLLSAVAGCHSDSGVASSDLSNYTFDSQVIAKLPVYDSLVTVIIGNFPLFKKQINEEESYRSFRYMPQAENDGSGKLPQEIVPQVEKSFARLGKNFIYGFDVFRDSTIKIYIRKTLSEKNQVEISENLSYYPAGKVRRREYPERDTVLNKNWQYWARFDQRELF